MNAKICAKCGAELDAKATEGLCPACLMKAGLDIGADTITGVPPSAGNTFQQQGAQLDIEEVRRRFPHLEIIEQIGRGGMGVVFKARQPQLDRLVALKILPADLAKTPGFAERFTREARTLAKLNHPNIVAIFDFGRQGDFFYFLMEYVDGANLGQLIAAKEIKPESALAIVPKICEALQYAHDEGILHRDIKPANILIDKKGRLKIADFGLAKLLGVQEMDFTLTTTGMALGTPKYMAPEQIENTKTVDHRADIYSLGVVFYELLTGELPLGRFDVPSRKVQVDVRLDEVVLHTLEKDPARRYQHASEVKTDVENITQSKPAPAPAKPSAKRKIIFAAAAGILALIAALAAWQHYAAKPATTTASTLAPATPQTDFTYTTNNNAITITKYNGPGGVVNIPGKINGLPVVTIGYESFMFQGNITSVTLPDSVTNIEDIAFWGCSQLTNVTLGKCLRRIGGQSLGSCPNLSDIIIPSSVNTIVGQAFRLSGLTNIVIPASVTSIVDVTPFNGCHRLVTISVDAKNPIYSSDADGVLFNKDRTCLIGYPVGKPGSYVVPNSVTNIAQWSFGASTELTSVTIHKLVTYIHVRSFVECSKLKSIIVDVANPAYCSSADGVLFTKDKSCLVSYPGGKTGSYEIPNGVSKIGETAFQGCPYITSVTIPESVTAIDVEAFAGCQNLTAVYFKGSAPWCSGDAFAHSSKPTVYYQPGTKGWGPEFGGRPTAPWNPQAETASVPYTYTTNSGAITITKYTGPGGDVTIPSTINGLPVTCIGDNAFIYCANLTSATIPDSVTSIGSRAFLGCFKLISVTIPNSVTTIGYQAFWGCVGLTNITIPNSVTSIEWQTFCGCHHLAKVAISRSVTSIGVDAFIDCKGLMLFDVDAENPTYSSSKDGVLFDKEKTCLVRYTSGKAGSYVIPNSVKSISGCAFNDSANLTRVVIPNSVTNISWSFCNCTSLTNAVIPDSVVNLDAGAFSGCHSLNVFVVDPANPTYSSSEDGFLFDKEKTCLVGYPGGKAGSCELPNSVSKIAQNAFRNSPYLTSVIVPADVTSVGAEAFRECQNLTAVYFKGNVPRLEKDVFIDSNKATIYYQPGTAGWGKEFGGRPTAVWVPEKK